MNERRTHGRRTPAAVLCAATLLLVAGCVVNADTAEVTAGDLPTAIAEPPAEPTAAVIPTPVPPPPPTATPLPPAPTPTPAPLPPAEPTPLVPKEPNLAVVPDPVPAGTVAVDVGGITTFDLRVGRPVLQLPGHTLVYIDAGRQGEVDIWEPAFDRDAQPLADQAAVVAYLTADPVFADVVELQPVEVAGYPARVFDGRPVFGDRSFYTDVSTLTNENAGWYPPPRMRLWLIDGPNGVIAVSAEAIEDDRYSEALRLATSILATMEFES